MKKSELKVGEEYAVFAYPGAVRRFLNDSHRSRKGTQPLRVTLLAIDAVESRWTRGSYSSAYTPGKEKGHKVSIPSNDTDHSSRAVIEITIYKNYEEQAIADGLKLLPEEDNAFSRGTRRAEWTRDSLILENAGCFISTWADYEASLDAAEKAAKAHEDRKLQERLANDAAGPAIEAKLAAVLDRLCDFGEVKLSGSYYGDDNVTRRVEVEGPGFKLTGEKLYRDSEVERSVLAGASFKLNLSSLATLLGIES